MHEQNDKYFKAGSFLYIEGDEESGYIYLIKKGHVKFIRSNNQITRKKKRSRDGDIIGSISAFCNRPRLESAIAETDVIASEISKKNFLLLLQKNYQIALKILNNFTRELDTYNNLLISQNGKKMTIENEINLFKLSEYYFNKNINIAGYTLNKYLELYPRGRFKKDAARMLNSFKNPQEIKKNSLPVINNMEKHYHNNQIIFCEYETGNELYIIKSGSIKIIKYKNQKEILLSILKAGDIFGELALISNKERNATAVSFGNTVLYAINKNALKQIMSSSTDILKKIFISISQRIWFTSIRVETKLYEKPVTRIYAFLEKKLMEEKISLHSAEPYTFNFGMDELLRMIELKQNQIEKYSHILFSDPNISFAFGQICVLNPQNLSARADFYKARDSIKDIEERHEKENIANNNLSPLTTSDYNIHTEHGPDTIEEKISTEIENPLASAVDIPVIDTDQIKTSSADLQFLIKNLSEKNSHTIISAISRLSELGQQAAAAIPSLIEKLSEKNKKIVLLTIKALKNIASDNIYTEVAQIALKRLKKTTSDSLIKKESKNALKTLKKADKRTN